MHIFYSGLLFLGINYFAAFGFPEGYSLESVLHAPPGLFSSQSSNPFGGLSGIAGLATLPTQLSSITSNPDAFKSLYNNFKKVFNKDTPATEDNKRMGIFKSELFSTLDHNMKAIAGQKSYEKGINQFSDMTDKEVVDQNTGYKPENGTEDRGTRGIFHIGNRERRAAPNSIDWRSYGIVSPVKNQKSCGSCTLFACTGALESAWKKKKGGPILDLSEQELLDCIPPGNGHGGCGGNSFSSTLAYQTSHGQGAEVGYEAKVGTCRRTSVLAKLSNYDRIEKDENALKEALGTVGPTPVSVNISPIKGYHSGVFSDNCEGKSNHAVLAVGYGNENGMDFWLIKNSWGPKWGDKGYFKIRRNAGNLCNIANSAYVVTV